MVNAGGESTEAPTEGLRRGPLRAEHEALGARMVPFAGWEMPIEYAGVRAEHLAVRAGWASSTSRTWARSRPPAPSRGAAPAPALQRRLAARRRGRPVLVALPSGRRRPRRPVHLSPRRAALPDGDERRQPRARPQGSAPTPADSRLSSTRAIATRCSPSRAAPAGSPPRCWPASFPPARRVAERAPKRAAGGGRALVCATGYTGEDGVEVLLDPADAPAPGGRCWAPARALPGSRRATPCASRPACPSMATSCRAPDADRGRARVVLPRGDGLHRRGGGRPSRERGPERLAAFRAHRARGSQSGQSGDARGRTGSAR